MPTVLATRSRLELIQPPPARRSLLADRRLRWICALLAAAVAAGAVGALTPTPTSTPAAFGPFSYVPHS